MASCATHGQYIFAVTHSRCPTISLSTILYKRDKDRRDGRDGRDRRDTWEFPISRCPPIVGFPLFSSFQSILQLSMHKTRIPCRSFYHRARKCSISLNSCLAR